MRTLGQLLALAVVVIAGVVILTSLSHTPASESEPQQAGSPGRGQLAQSANTYSQPAASQGCQATYRDTQGSATLTWAFTLPAGCVAIIGGYRVDGQSDGVYKAIRGAGQPVSVTVTDGFLSIVPEATGQQEFCTRVQQAVQHNWAHGVVQPLTGWSSC